MIDQATTIDNLRDLGVTVLQARSEAAEGRPAPALPDLANRILSLRTVPVPSDISLVALADRIGLTDFELLAAALCLAADDDPQIARLVARAQDPIGGSRPLIGMLSAILRPLGATPLALVGGSAVQAGLLTLGDERAALPERSIGLPLAVAAALSGHDAPPAGIEHLAATQTQLTKAQEARAQSEAKWLGESDASHLLVIRSSSQREAVALCSTIARNLGRSAVAINAEAVAPNAAWLMVRGALPCLRVSLGPGERVVLPSFGRFTGPAIVIAEPEGAVEAPIPLREWAVGLPDEDERRALWQSAGFDRDTAARAAQGYRQGAGRIAELAERAATVHGGQPDWQSLVSAVASSRTRLDGLARRSQAHLARKDLVIPEAAQADLDRLVGRISERNRLADDLGPAITGRYRPGVRALFTGESGTGKTLAAHWLANETGLPLYRVDQAALTSKWIGETEKNLSTILDAAQHADVVLFFDEADSLFGARTDVRDSGDRHANAQTNYLLQRIEDHEGVVILATNSRDRFDPAFVRRLDTILAFPMPDARARQQLWRVHLGSANELTEDDVGRLALAIDLAGGHIRNIVLGAAVRARMAQRAIDMTDIVAATADEFAKLGRAAPAMVP